VATCILWKSGKEKFMDFSGFKRFYFLGLIILFSADISSFISSGSVEVELLFEKFMYCILTWLLILLISSLEDSHMRIGFRIVCGITVVLTFVQLMISFGGEYWVWGGTGMLEELILNTSWSRFVHFFWVLGSVTIGIFVMQLMSSVKKDNEYVDVLFLVLIHIVLFLGIAGYGFYPRVWFWIFSGFYLGVVDKYIDFWLDVKEKARPRGVNILGLKVDNVDVEEAVERMDNLIKSKKLHLVITPYSEFFVKIQKNKSYKRALAYASLSIPDGIFVNWASLYQRLPVSSNILIRFFQTMWQYVITGASIVFFPRLVRAVMKAHVSGSDIIYPLCELAAKKKYRVMFYGGFDFGNGNTGVLAARKLKKMYKGLNIVNVYPGDKKNENDDEALELINKHRPDILLMCLGTREPEWVYKRRKQMNCGVVLGLGCTFDYVAGDAIKVNNKISEAGLEWFLRPLMLWGTGGVKSALKRFKRVWTGMLVGSLMILAWKLKFGYIEE